MIRVGLSSFLFGEGVFGMGSDDWEAVSFSLVDGSGKWWMIRLKMVGYIGSPSVCGLMVIMVFICGQGFRVFVTVWLKTALGMAIRCGATW